jgi:hypothetical protein
MRPAASAARDIGASLFNEDCITRDRNRSLAIPKINRHKSSIGYQHRAILSQLPARLNLRQGQPWDGLL